MENNNHSSQKQWVPNQYVDRLEIKDKKENKTKKNKPKHNDNRRQQQNCVSG
jgi:hypothetical protein